MLRQSAGLLMLALLLSACAGKSRYHLDEDRPPDQHVDVSQVAEPTPRHEVRSRGGNKNPYEVWGKTYHVLDTAQGYSEEGVASWYGSKFHGYKTSNGEIYNMYAFSAAHKHLPLPSYVRVTNLENGRSVIVRVNDRGPFHGGRIIDLSYAAASRLDMLKTGTARVRVENVTPPPPMSAADLPPPTASTAVAGKSVTGPVAGSPPATAEAVYLQVGAYSAQPAAERIRMQVAGIVDRPVTTRAVSLHDSSIYRVRIGPYQSRDAAAADLERLRLSSFPDALLVSGD